MNIEHICLLFNLNLKSLKYSSLILYKNYESNFFNDFVVYFFYSLNYQSISLIVFLVLWTIFDFSYKFFIAQNTSSIGAKVGEYGEINIASNYVYFNIKLLCLFDVKLNYQEISRSYCSQRNYAHQSIFFMLSNETINLSAFNLSFDKI